MSALSDQVGRIDSSLTEASNELVALIQQLRDQIAAGTDVVDPATQAMLDTAETKAKALADIVPNADQPPVTP